MLMIMFTLALIAGSTQLSTMAEYMLSPEVGLRVSLGLALLALTMVAIAENARIPVDNLATHLELTMVHEAMVPGSGRHLVSIELTAAPCFSSTCRWIACLFAPWGMAAPDAPAAALVIGGVAYVGQRSRTPPLFRWRCLRRRSPRCGCSGCPSSWAPR